MYLPCLEESPEVLQVWTLPKEGCRGRGWLLWRSGSQQGGTAHHGKHAYSYAHCSLMSRSVGWESKAPKLLTYPKWNWPNDFEEASWSLVSQHRAWEGVCWQRETRAQWDSMATAFVHLGRAGAQPGLSSQLCQLELGSEVVHMWQFLPTSWIKGPADWFLLKTTLTSSPTTECLASGPAGALTCPSSFCLGHDGCCCQILFISVLHLGQNMFKYNLPTTQVSRQVLLSSPCYRWGNWVFERGIFFPSY